MKAALIESEKLITLEKELHDPAVRKDRLRLGGLLHEAFVEIGRSGALYNKTDILASLDSEQSHSVWSQDYDAQALNAQSVLLTYRSAHIGNDGELSRFSRRASLWEKHGNDWKLRYHQGTPAAAFDKS